MNKIINFQGARAIRSGSFVIYNGCIWPFSEAILSSDGSPCRIGANHHIDTRSKQLMWLANYFVFRTDSCRAIRT